MFLKQNLEQNTFSYNEGKLQIIDILSVQQIAYRLARSALVVAQLLVELLFAPCSAAVDLRVEVGGVVVVECVAELVEEDKIY